MATDQKTGRVHVQLIEGYQFRASFPDVAGAAESILDEAASLGQGATGPGPIEMLAAAVGGCVSASLTRCLNDAHLEPDAMNAHVTAHLEPNDAGHLRVTGIDVDLTPCLARDDEAGLDRCVRLYEDFGTVVQSIRHGIPVNVRVSPCSHRLRQTVA